MAEPMILCENLVKIYKVADLEVVALQGLDLAVESGELVAIVGASGSGKSTLQNILGGVDVPTAGRVEVDGRDLASLSEGERTPVPPAGSRLRLAADLAQPAPVPDRRRERRAADDARGRGSLDRAGRVRSLLELVGLGGRAHHRPDALSGGEQQRVAVAIALSNNPSVLLADEPTGELDSENSAHLFETLQAVSHELGVTVVVLTHDPLVSEQVERTIGIRDGRTATETLRRLQGEELVSEELAVLDRAGRLQLPRDYVDALSLERRVRLALEPDHISIRPEDGDD